MVQPGREQPAEPARPYTIVTPDLLNEAQSLLGFKSKTDTVVLSLTELVRRRRIDELKSLAGKIELELDVGVSRRRAKSVRKSVGGTRRTVTGRGR